MEISKSIETPEGTVKFQGEITGKELDIVIQFGLLSLMSRGAIQTMVAAAKDEDNIH